MIASSTDTEDAASYAHAEMAFLCDRRGVGYTHSFAGQAIWHLLDVVLLSVVFAAASNGLSRVGHAGYAWLFAYPLLLVRMLPVFPAFVVEARRNLAFLLYPLVCVGSAIWSPVPVDTLKASVQVSFTIVFGMYVGWRFETCALLRALFLLTSATTLLSLLELNTSFIGGENFTPHGEFVGVFSHKNMLGISSAICLLGSIAILISAPGHRSHWLKLLGLLSVPSAMLMLIKSGSVSALCVALLSVFLLVCLDLWERSRLLRILIPFAAISTLAVTPFMLLQFQIDPIATFLEASGKDVTLTGRTELWEVAQREIAVHPVAGAGFGAFWSALEFEAARALIDDDLVSFHNAPLNVLIGTGVLGLAAWAMLIGVTAQKLLTSFRECGRTTDIWALSTFVLLVVCSLFTTSLYRQHELPLIVVVALGVSASVANRNRNMTPLGF